MTGIQRCVAAAAVAVALIGTPTVAHALSQGGTAPVSVESVAWKAPSARIVSPGEHVEVSGGAEFWLTEEGKHWTTPENPDPQFRSVVDGNIDRSRPGVSLQTEGAGGHYLLSGVYYGGKGTASRVVVRTTAGVVHGKLLELPGKPGWGVWYATVDLSDGDTDGLGVSRVVVRDTEGKVYSRLNLG
ncbi:hypothetical protein JCM4814A_84290 [Streptomyces phaeofaciens JCM 4814]|uniref:Secreted protein n=1 Tax=Streptomyces phaeofaciens TaxID=68254 RepID=A0A918HSM3_9ACTN|nr:hypothetical protein [Streptomyces phaeofaciens]GGU00314.1 hypothetical protein GCM10010226_91540 [Streptomyces phaeofaciens]